MPYGILSSAPEVSQRHMYGLIEGVTGAEVVADDFVVAVKRSGKRWLSL